MTAHLAAANGALAELLAIRDRVRAERATARRADAAREGYRRIHLNLIDRCPGCGAWRYNARCTTPPRTEGNR